MIPVQGLDGAQVAVLGLGRSGLAAARALAAGGAVPICWDDNPDARARAEAEGFACADLKKHGAFDAIARLIVSPGIPHLYPVPNPVVAAALDAGVPVDNDIGLFFQSFATSEWDSFDVMPRVVALAEIVQFVRSAAGSDDIHINDAVATSETFYGHRNFALAHFLAARDNLLNSPEKALGTYFHHCALEMTTTQLAMAGRFLVHAPGMPRLVSPRRIRRLNALMLTCGHYDGSGDFAYRVGLPAKSGVGGGILAIVPNRAAIAVWSPGLNRYGNSHKGTEALAQLTTDMNWSIF